jgi:Cytolethal distending toxin A/C domain
MARVIWTSRIAPAGTGSESDGCHATKAILSPVSRQRFSTPNSIIKEKHRMNNRTNARLATSFLTLAFSFGLYAPDVFAQTIMTFKSSQTGLCLQGVSTGVISTTTCNSTKRNQNWEKVDFDTNGSILKNRGNDLCLQMSGGNLSSGSCSTAKPQQRWSLFSYDLLTKYMIVSMKDSRCIYNLRGTGVSSRLLPNCLGASEGSYLWINTKR